MQDEPIRDQRMLHFMLTEFMGVPKDPNGHSNAKLTQVINGK